MSDEQILKVLNPDSVKWTVDAGQWDLQKADSLPADTLGIFPDIDYSKGDSK